MPRPESIRRDRSRSSADPGYAQDVTPSPALLPFAPVLHEKVWGGTRLEALVGVPPTGRAIGEAWLVHETSVVRDGPAAGRTLADLAAHDPTGLLGSLGSGFVVDGVPRFPLLVKFLDASEWLSIQVHPDDAYARSHEGEPYGKCEFWAVLDAQPGAEIIHGLDVALTPEALIEAASSGSIRDLFSRVPLETGDVVINMPGVIHAVGPGLVIYELQQSSDITYRLYDWDRPASDGRALHLRQSADVSDVERIETHTVTPLALGADRTMLTACTSFACERLEVRGALARSTHGRSCHILTVVAGSGTVRTGGDELPLERGGSVVVAAHAGDYVVAGDLTVHCGYVPDLERDVIEPLRAAGATDAAIAGLGGERRMSDLAHVLHRERPSDGRPT